MYKRVKAKELFMQSGIIDNAYNWHIWKRAFDLGWAYCGQESNPKTKPIEERIAIFEEKVLKNTVYQNVMLIEFIDYWTEHGEKDRKMRFEKQTSFDIKRRLKTWLNRSTQYQTKSSKGVNSAWSKE